MFIYLNAFYICFIVNAFFRYEFLTGLDQYVKHLSHLNKANYTHMKLFRNYTDIHLSIALCKSALDPCLEVSIPLSVDVSDPLFILMVFPRCINFLADYFIHVKFQTELVYVRYDIFQLFSPYVN